MADYIFTEKAVMDLSEIWNYTFTKWSEHLADIYYNLIIGSCSEVAQNPKIGTPFPGIAQNLLGFKTGRHIIFYRLLENHKVEITRILHEKMNLKNRLST